MNLIKQIKSEGMRAVYLPVLVLILLTSGCAGMQKAPVEKAAKPETLPLESKQAVDPMLEKIKAEGEDAVVALADKLVAPGTGDDTDERYILHALAIDAYAPDADFRNTYNKAIVKALEKQEDKEVKGFLIRQLQVSGDGSVVDALSQYLTDEDLCLTASQALLVIQDDKVTESFRKALGKTRGMTRCQISILNALGQLRDKKAASAVEKLLAGKNRDIRMAANYALASIGDPKSKAALLKATKTDDSYDKVKAMRYYILYGQSLAVRGEEQKAVDLCREVLQKGDYFPNNTQCAALHTLSEIRGAKVIEDLLPAMANSDFRVRSKAMELTLDYSDNAITRDIVEYYEQEATPEIQAEILRFFARKGDLKVLPVVFDSLEAKESVVRLAAVESVAKLAGEASVNALLDVMATDDAEELTAVETALVEIPESEATDAIAAGLQDSHPQVQATTLNILKARKASGAEEQIVALGTATSQTVRLAALSALETLATEDSIPNLSRFLLNAGRAKELKAAEKALHSAVERAENKDTTTDILKAYLDRTNDTEKTVSLIGALRRTGTEDAMNKVKGYLKSDNEDLVDASVRALADWPNAKPIDILPKLVKDSDSKVHQVLALRGFVRQAGLPSDRSSAETLNLYKKAMKLTDRADEKKKILSSMAELKSLEALRTISRHIGDEQLNEEAIAAAMSVLPNVAYANPDESQKISKKIRQNTESEKILEKLDQTEKIIEEYEGYIINWEVAGPYYKEGVNGPNALFDVAFAPEEKNAEVEWKTITTDIPDRPWLVDFKKRFNRDHSVAYVRAIIDSPKAQKAVLELGSDDGAKAWVNGKVVSRTNEPRGFAPGSDKADIRLKKGENILMIKVTQGGGDWSVGARVRSADNAPAEGLTYVK